MIESTRAQVYRLLLYLLGIPGIGVPVLNSRFAYKGALSIVEIGPKDRADSGAFVRACKACGPYMPVFKTFVNRKKRSSRDLCNRSFVMCHIYVDGSRISSATNLLPSLQCYVSAIVEPSCVCRTAPSACPARIDMARSLVDWPFIFPLSTVISCRLEIVFASPFY